MNLLLLFSRFPVFTALFLLPSKKIERGVTVCQKPKKLKISTYMQIEKKIKLYKGTQKYRD
jgi:hypothetical protein